MKWIKLVSLALLFSTAPAWSGVSLKGVGSYLAAPLAQRWAQDYGQAHPDTKWKVEVKNSADTADQWIGRGAEFAAIDTPLSDPQQKRLLGRAFFHLPVAMEAVAITYNLPGIPTGLKLTPRALSAVFLGTVTKWNDPAIAESNPGVRLPAMDIRVVHREEESTLRDFFPHVLSQLDPKWTLKREKDKNLHWPVGQNVKGNEKVVEKMRLWPGVIAAVDYPYAAQHHLPVAALRNEAGGYVAPDLDSIEAAASDLLDLPEDFTVNLAASRSKKAYPLSTFTWLLVYQDLARATHDTKRNLALTDFLKWVLADGQKDAAALDYVPLPERFLPRVEQAVESLQTGK